MFHKLKLSRESAAIAKHSLTDVYRTFKADLCASASDTGNDPTDLWAEMAPAGNIYRINAVQTEHLKHQEDLHQQLAELADEFSGVWENCADPPQTQEHRIERLIHELAHTECRDSDALEEAGVSSFASGPQGCAGSGERTVSAPICEFLCLGKVERHLFGLLLLPASPKVKLQFLKAKVFGLLIAAIQISGPFMIFAKNWNEDTNHFRDGDFFGRVTWKEFTCLGSWTDTMCTVMGTLFLILVLEICRGYAKDEVQNCQKSSRLPVDQFWTQVGQLTNILSILFTAMCMPVLFWGEMAPKDIVFDSLGLLFIFQLDDLAGEACAFLDTDDAGFQRMAGWLFALLTRCPVHLRDVTNVDAEVPGEVWQIRMTSTCLRSVRTGDSCEVRIGSEVPHTLSGSDSIQDSNREYWMDFNGVLSSLTCGVLPARSWVSLWKGESVFFKANCFRYRVVAAGPASSLPCRSWTAVFIEKCWVLLCVWLIVIEVVFPLLFFVLNKPCVKI